jgi:hypothetical protein
LEELMDAQAGRPWNSSGWKDKPWSAPHLAPLFTELTSDSTSPIWASRAVRFIRCFTRKHGEAPTFREVFENLATYDPDYEHHAEAWASHAVRGLAMSHWRRQGWIHYRPSPRTLRAGPSAIQLLHRSTEPVDDDYAVSD